jgi:hypothetical protein
VLGFAAGGSRGIAEADEEDECATAAAPAGCLDASDRPGATTETSAAKPAVSAAVPAMTHRRVRLTRANAASRASTARDWSLPLVIRSSLGIMFQLSEQGISAQ